MTRLFPLEEWAPTQEAQPSSYPSSYTPSNDSYEVKDSLSTFGFRNRLRSLPMNSNSDFADSFQNLSLRNSNPAEDGKKEGGFRGLFRRASLSIKAKRNRRHSHVPEDQPRPTTSSSTLWIHKLRGAASFNRHSRLIHQ